ncbi:RHS repeat-associated core domain-containing protein [Marinobacterium aestuarii]|uniref:RHS repeat-associated core domain-containing protein n=1 Tax=Marinobacterium aestuarii TaxID=1821621 RepID=UPI001D1297AE|nr:RHS repeat-associated core domain-containing protein [Marinobacterium aestuarii]
MRNSDEALDDDGQRFTFNLRFPGQYFYAETGLYYNYFRYYNPSTGRYILSDQIGLDGGLNTYGYSYKNIIFNIDPDGNLVWFIPPVYWASGAAAAAAIVLINNSILGNVTDDVYVPGFPDPIDPWKDTSTEERVPIINPADKYIDHAAYRMCPARK